MNLLNLDDEKFKTVNVKGYQFKIRFETPLDTISIGQRRRKLQNGDPVELMTQDEFNLCNAVAICDTCIDEYPKGFSLNESSIRWDDEELILMVALEIKKHTDDVKAKLKKNKPDIGGEGK